MGSETKNDYAGEDQQQFTGLITHLLLVPGIRYIYLHSPAAIHSVMRKHRGNFTFSVTFYTLFLILDFHSGSLFMLDSAL
jgi:hypothetical protein